MQDIKLTGTVQTVVRGPMVVYIASSWRNAHGVELLTKELRALGCEVISWIENNFGEDHNHVTKKMDFETWVNSEDSKWSFKFDTDGAMCADVFIYYGPAGMDAAAELGAAFGSGENIAILGLWAKGEQLGLMRNMVDKWHHRVSELIYSVYEIMVGGNFPIKKSDK